MALQSFGGIIFAPDYPPRFTGNAPAFGDGPVDADGEGRGMVFECPETGTITGMGAMFSTITTGDTGLLWQLTAVDVTATPGIPNTASIHATTTLNPTASAWNDATFDASYSATKGDLLAVIIRRPSSGAFNGNIRHLAQLDAGNAGNNFPYMVTNTGAGWVANFGAAPVFAVNFGGTYYQIKGSYPISAVNTTSVNSGATPDVVGARWIPRFKCRVTGCWLFLTNGASTGTFNVKFYDTDGTTVLATALWTQHARAVSGLPGSWFLPFSTTITPTVGSTYWIGIEPTTATAVALYDFTIPSAAIMASLSLKSDFAYDSSKDPSGTGSWTGYSATRKPLMGVAIDQFDDGVGGGSGSIFNIME
jgi:hypothetical protein